MAWTAAACHPNRPTASPHHPPQLRAFETRHAQLQARLGPLVQRLPELQAELDPRQLEALAGFAHSQGLQQPLAQVGLQAAGQWGLVLGRGGGAEASHATDARPFARR